MYKGKFVYEIKKEDVGKAFIRLEGCSTCGAKGKTVPTSGFLGVVLKHDVGKQVFETSPSVYQVESKEQLEKRLSR